MRASAAIAAVVAAVIATAVLVARSVTHEEAVAPSPVALPELPPEPTVSPPALPFVDITADSGIDFLHTNLADGEKLLPETMGGGVALFDYDSDGDQDLLLVDSNHWPETGRSDRRSSVRLYANDGNARFRDVTEQMTLAAACYGMGVAVGDYDNDGDPDVYVTAVGSNLLLRNDGTRFVDVTAEAGVAGGADDWGTSCAWFDYDNDGLLDLLVGNYVTWSRDIDLAQEFALTGVGRAYGPPFSFAGSFPLLFHNLGGGRFEDVSEAAGLRVRNPATRAAACKTLGVCPIDVNRDGLLDVVLANDTVANLLLVNDGRGRFREEGTLSGLAYDASGKARGAMGIDAGYFRGDRELGVAIGNFANEMTALYTSRDGTLFIDDAIASGLGPTTRPDLSFGLFFFDADLDGRLDLLAANGHIEGEIERVQASQRYRQPTRLFWNAGPNGPSEFLPARETGDLSKPLVGRGAAYGDLDGDGDLDAVVTQIAGPPAVFRNDQSTGRHFVRLKLVGKECNRDAIGAEVTAWIGGRVVRRRVMPTRSYLSQVELPVTIGLGDSDSVERLVVSWPDRSEQTVDGVVIDGLTVIQQADAP